MTRRSSGVSRALERDRLARAPKPNGELDCPIFPGNRCPYPDSQCGKACVDSWDGEHCFRREGDKWVWTGDK